MADFSELIIGGAQKSAAQAGEGVADSYAKGAQLALAAEDLELKKANAAREARQLQQTKVDKFNDALDKAQRWTDPKARANYLKNVMPRIRDAYGLQDTISDETLSSLISDDEARGKYYTLNLYVQKGLIQPEEALKIANDQVKFSEIPSTPVEMRGKDDLSTDEAFKTLQDNQAKAAQLQQSGNQFQQGQTATATRDRLDRKEKLDKKITDLGIQDFQTDINTLDAGIPGGIKGWKGGQIPGISGDQGKMPTSELSGQAAQNRQALQRLVNIQLKKMSGSAVMDQELARNLEALGVSTTYLNGTWTSNLITGLKKSPSPEKVLQGIRYLERSTSNEVRKLQNTYGKDLYDEVTAGTETGAIRVSPQGKTTPEGDTTPPASDKVSNAVESVKRRIPNFASLVGQDVEKLKATLAKSLSPQDVAAAMKQLGIK